MKEAASAQDDLLKAISREKEAEKKTIESLEVRVCGIAFDVCEEITRTCCLVLLSLPGLTSFSYSVLPPLHYFPSSPLFPFFPFLVSKQAFAGRVDVVERESVRGATAGTHARHGRL